VFELRHASRGVARRETSSSTGEKRAQARDATGSQRDAVLVFEKRMKVGCRRRHDVPVGPFAGGFRKGALQDWAG
jgi:hypothetical protein